MLKAEVCPKQCINRDRQTKEEHREGNTMIEGVPKYESCPIPGEAVFFELSQCWSERKIKQSREL